MMTVVGIMKRVGQGSHNSDAEDTGCVRSDTVSLGK